VSEFFVDRLPSIHLQPGLEMARAQAWAPGFFAPERKRARWKRNTSRVSARSGAQFIWARRAPRMSAALHAFHFEFHIFFLAYFCFMKRKGANQSEFVCF